MFAQALSQSLSTAVKQPAMNGEEVVPVMMKRMEHIVCPLIRGKPSPARSPAQKTRAEGVLRYPPWCKGG